MPDLTPIQWLAQCAERLRERWPTVDQAELEAASVVVWSDASLRELPPQEAAARWLAPVNSSRL